MPILLTINGGSSSIRFSTYQADEGLERLLVGKIDRIGSPSAMLHLSGPDKLMTMMPCLGAVKDHQGAIKCLLDWIEERGLGKEISAIGHRVVHGMRRSEPERVTLGLMEELRQMKAIDPEHQPGELALIEAFQRRYPKLPQVACFDTAFHRSMPRVAKLVAIPRRYEAAGVERYGFHGLSYGYLMEELARLDPLAAKGRVILAHLGNGSSLAAVKEGRSLDTSMGFTPASGLPMGTRSGDLDPGLACYLSRSEAMSAARFQQMVNHESGLLGVSETSSDLRDLLTREKNDVRAAEAIALFCYQTKKWIGSYAAVLGGLDILVFAGGIGENSAGVRSRICEGLEFLGIQIDEGRNSGSAEVISSDRSRAIVRVIPTNEEVMIARSTWRTLVPSGGV